MEFFVYLRNNSVSFFESLEKFKQAGVFFIRTSGCNANVLVIFCKMCISVGFVFFISMCQWPPSFEVNTKQTLGFSPKVNIKKSTVLKRFRIYTHFFYKNTVYKNHQDQISPIFKNGYRIIPKRNYCKLKMWIF